MVHGVVLGMEVRFKLSIASIDSTADLFTVAMYPDAERQYAQPSAWYLSL
jgi:hypothetical protein